MNLLVSLINVWMAVKIIVFSPVVRFSSRNKRILIFNGWKSLVDRKSVSLSFLKCSASSTSSEQLQVGLCDKWFIYKSESKLQQIFLILACKTEIYLLPAL